MMIGFVISWPIGAAILAAITIVAISQQLTGYRPPQRVPPQQPYQPLPATAAISLERGAGDRTRSSRRMN